MVGYGPKFLAIHIDRMGSSVSPSTNRKKLPAETQANDRSMQDQVEVVLVWAVLRIDSQRAIADESVKVGLQTAKSKL
jgi:hypothetical protein